MFFEPSCFVAGSAVKLNSQGPVFLFWVNLDTKAKELYVFLQPFLIGEDFKGIEQVKAGLGQKLCLSKLFLFWPSTLSSSAPTFHDLLVISLIKLKFNQSLYFHIFMSKRKHVSSTCH